MGLVKEDLSFLLPNWWSFWVSTAYNKTPVGSHQTVMVSSLWHIRYYTLSSDLSLGIRAVYLLILARKKAALSKLPDHPVGTKLWSKL